ncbi:MAG: bifunctional DNA-formamidopyrimidine glycosylase/DNA-(apurinic or apyrimidinic site) lyase [Proteobacteria bacterium]|uniref:bifunctional DNA-formamidopyrimidine glycosylase/DNA-(apurinic or apyrimidinic site) lyase n=1 Tax=Ottowia sp. TaxID=1898956 RepID=UPI001DBB436C|nr:bifunctional DNA-formamidopyrimidine glycosylase/DNA-(apurinic or apyrimidinic site) lyase [Ottowia sp.]MBS0403331.1 bifunctional DNA-formamidopyrimidine glycosylase/DNA-(apurinic or apyrimidinic site) lyase [Pseudomonadota bacterium]
MPELPEVEVTRRSFADRIQGARIERVRMGKPLRWPLGVSPETLAGHLIRGVRRRGKYLLMDLDEGLLLLHLGMSGRLQFAADLPPPGTHDHMDMQTDHGVLRLHDPRRFGAVVWAADEAREPARKLLAGLGAEPLDEGFDPAAFHAALKRRRAPIKQVLLAGDVVVGVGNIYASEALFMAGIRPTVRADRLSRARSDRLHAAVQAVLGRAVERGGTTLRDFANAMGETGHFQLDVAVYGRAGQPCVVCATPIRLLRQGQRSSFYCPVCQRV